MQLLVQVEVDRPRWFVWNMQFGDEQSNAFGVSQLEPFSVEVLLVAVMAFGLLQIEPQPFRPQTVLCGLVPIQMT